MSKNIKNKFVIHNGDVRKEIRKGKYGKSNVMGLDDNNSEDYNLNAIIYRILSKNGIKITYESFNAGYGVNGLNCFFYNYEKGKVRQILINNGWEEINQN